MAAKFELYKDRSDQYRWRLKSANGEIIASSGEGYTTKSSAQNGLDAVRRDAPEARVVEVT